MVFYFILLLVFTQFDLVLRLTISDPDDYGLIDTTQQLFINVFRNTIGDNTTPDVTIWSSIPTEAEEYINKVTRTNETASNRTSASYEAIVTRTSIMIHIIWLKYII